MSTWLLKSPSSWIILISIFLYTNEYRRYLWCNDYCCRKWIWWPKFKSWMMVSLFNGISTFLGYLMSNPSSYKKCCGTIYPIAGKIRGFIPSKDICPKVNIIVQLEFELTYYNSAVYRFNHYTMRTPSPILDEAVCISHNTLGKGMNPTILPPAMGK